MSRSAGKIQSDLSLNGVLSLRRMWCSTPLANPMSHLLVKNTLGLSESFCISHYFHIFGMGESPKLSSGKSIVLRFCNRDLCHHNNFMQVHKQCSPGRWSLMTHSTSVLGICSITNTLGGRASEEARFLTLSVNFLLEVNGLTL